MAKVKITGHASGSGVLTVTAPNTSTDRTITLPDATATIATTTDVAARLPSITDGGNATAITIDSSERVGVGATSLNRKLTILTTNQTDVAITAANNQYAQLCFGDPEDDNIGVLGYNNSDNSMSFTTNTTAQLKITSDGRGLSQFTAKVWCNFNGTATAAIRDSHNVSSLTDNGTGDFTIAFSNNMGNTNYCSSIGNYRGTGDTGIGGSNLKAVATGSLRFETIRDGSSKVNPTFCNLLIFGD